MRIGSLFSGVGGFDLGLERAGHEIVWQVEKDGQCRQVLKHRWPDVDLYEDVTDVGADQLSGVDLLCGGFPCQDLSVAGKREGLGGERSGLWWEFHRIIGELTPAWVLIENVPGLLSSNYGEDMAVILRGLEELGYGWSYRILDSQYWGVAQRRRRVFIVGHLGGPCPPEVLLEPEGLLGDSAPSRQTRARIAEGSLSRALGQVGGGNDYGANKGTLVANCLGASPSAGRTPNIGNGQGNVVTVAFKPSHYTRGKDGAPSAVVPPLSADADKGDQEVLAFNIYPAQGQGADLEASETEVSGALDGTSLAASTDRGTRIVSFRKAMKAHDPEDYERWEEAELSNTLEGRGDTAGVVPLSFQERGREGGRNLEVGGDVAYSLNSPGKGGRANENNVLAAVPRRLTPTECERLQGFPDGWTDVGGMKDGPRYRMMGNAVTVPVIEWIGRRFP